MKIPQRNHSDKVRNEDHKAKWVEAVRLATYGGFLCSFVQGLNVGPLRVYSQFAAENLFRFLPEPLKILIGMFR